LENNATTGSVTTASESGRQAPELARLLPDDAEIEKQLELRLSEIGNQIFSPKTLLIVRNATLTLLEVTGDATPEATFLLVADEQYRQGVVDKLVTETPNYWDDAWKAAWTKEMEPLYSRLQQRITRRRSLISFWTKEWDTLPPDQVKKIAATLKALT
jgi:hypothetical protein